LIDLFVLGSLDATIAGVEVNEEAFVVTFPWDIFREFPLFACHALGDWVLHDSGGEIPIFPFSKHVLKGLEFFQLVLGVVRLGDALVTRNYQEVVHFGNMLPRTARGVCRHYRFTKW
jgi:hypothetical protein